MSLLGRLYRSEFHVEFIARRKAWYALSAALITISVLSMVVRGFSLGIDFSGGAVFQFPANGGTVTQAEEAVAGAGIDTSDLVIQELYSAGDRKIRVQAPTLDEAQTKALQDEVVTRFHQASSDNVTVSTVGASWGKTITGKALQGLLVFFVVVMIYLAVRFEWKMAAAAMAAMIHDLVVTMGVYSLVGFEVTPSTVIALLTILGFSLYDTVVVFDRVRENTAGMGTSSKRTFAEATNDALNETLVRSLNTSLIALIPVASLLFVGAGLLGAGTLKDLALAQFVGIASGTYSSLFFATPLLVDLKKNEQVVKALDSRVARARATASKVAAQGTTRAMPRTAAGRPTLAKKSPGSAAPPTGGGRGSPAGSPAEDETPTSSGGDAKAAPGSSSGGADSGLEPAGASAGPRPSRAGRGTGSSGAGRRPGGRKPPRRGGNAGRRRK
jgi:preprotein translocase subunit SecF